MSKLKKLDLTEKIVFVHYELANDPAINEWTRDQLSRIFEDPSIGFVYTDALMHRQNSENEAFIQHYTYGDSIPKVPFYTRKELFEFIEDMDMEEAMKFIISKRYRFQHVAEIGCIINVA